ARFEACETHIAREVAAVPGIHVVLSRELLASYPVATYEDKIADEIAHMPYTPDFFAALGTMAARRVHALRSKPLKVIVLDADQTLWSGVCAEDGPHGILIDTPRRRLQEFMIAQHDAGALLCLCSKNERADVDAVFALRADDMPLKREHFVGWKVNWSPK